MINFFRKESQKSSFRLDYLKAILDRMKDKEELQYLVGYFNFKAQEVMDDLMSRSGALTKEDIVRANAEIEVYKSLANIHNTVTKEYKRIG